MAGKGEASRPGTQNIKTDLQSISSCTPATVTALQVLLNEKGDGITEKENDDGSKRTQIRGAQATARAKTRAPAASTTTVGAKKSLGLTPRERYVLATETANATLKSLAEALKSSSTAPSSRASSKPKPSEDVEAHTAASKRTRHTKTTDPSQKPLRERPVAQVTNSPVKPSATRPSSSKGIDSGLVATAECARLAFAYLRTPEAIKIAGKDAPVLQLENGILALVGKLVAHGLDTLAIRELRILKRRLDNFLGTEKSSTDGVQTAKRVAQKNQDISVEKETLASLLFFQNVDLESPVLPIIISHQSYTLRLITRTKNPGLVEESWNYLALSNPNSPAQLCWRAAKISSGDPRSVRQLESLSQTILSVCPSISASEDTTASQSRHHISPEIVLSLQHLAFKIRRRWWKLANHQGNISRDIFEPFAKCVGAFARRSGQTAIQKYRLAESSCRSLASIEEESGATDNTDLFSIPSVTDVLGNLAHAAGLDDEAIRWLGTPPPSQVQQPAIKTTCRLVRLATIAMDAAIKKSSPTESEPAVTKAIEALTGSLEGSSPDLDTLFVEVNSLRRISSRALCTTTKVQENSSSTYTLLDGALRVIKATIRFTVRYIGTRPTDGQSQQISRYQERTATVVKSLKSILDSMSLCCKTTFNTDGDTYWSNMDHLIQDCMSILCHYDGQSDSGHRFPDDLQYPFVKISNAYWSLYLHFKVANGNTGPAINAMQQSIDVLKSRSQLDRATGMISMKEERLGEVLHSNEKYQDSRVFFAQSIRSIIQCGVLQNAANLAAKDPVQHIFMDSNGPTVPLARLLKLYHQSFLKSSPTSSTEVAFYDDAELSASERGVLLEWQLTLYVKSLSRYRTWDSSLNHSLQSLSVRLLDMYSQEDFPIRRKRAAVVILQLVQDYPDIISRASIPPWVSFTSTSPSKSSEDGLLIRYEGHLEAQLKLKFLMLESPQEDTALNEPILFWQNLIRPAKSWKEVVNKVDDIEGLLQDLQNTSDYLIAKGDEYLSVSALQLLVNALEMQEAVDASRVVTALSNLGLQELLLGYSSNAGTTLAKAEKLLSKAEVSTETKLHWHITYAEYLVRIGNLDKCATILDVADSIAQGDTDFMNLSRSSTTISGRLRFNKIVAYACYVRSLFALRNGAHKDAAQYAKQCIGLNRKLWAALENRSNLRKGKEDDLVALSFRRTDNGAPVVMSYTHQSLNGSEFWALVPCLYRGLMQQSLVFAHQGLFPEAMYAAEQAEKIASVSKSRSMMLHNSGMRADLWAQSGRADKAKNAIASVSHVPASYNHISLVGYHSSKARICRLAGDFEDELTAYESLEHLLAKLTEADFLKTLKGCSSSVDELTEQMSSVSLNVSSKPSRTVRKPRVTGKAAPKPTTKTTTRMPRKMAQNAMPTTTLTPSSMDEGLILQSLRAEVAQRKALALLDLGDLDKASKSLDYAHSFETSSGPSFLALWANSKVAFSRSMKELSEDFTFNTLPESTIAFPSIAQNDRRLSTSSTGRRAKVTPPTIATGKGKINMKEDFTALLKSAREHLEETYALSSQRGSAHQIEQASIALSQVTVLLSAVSDNGHQGRLQPLYAAYMSEIPKLRSLQFIQDSIEVSQESASREQASAWPQFNFQTTGSESKISDFQRDFVDIIPPSWTAVALTLNEDCDELYITRYEAGLTPFVLRLPMGRQTSRDMDEVEFTIADGKREFEEIIYLSDFSTRSAKDMTSKEARRQWWEEREALDTKLHELLLNIENIWLGGFKGIFSQKARQPTLLAQFRKTFDSILNRHLPSRIGKGKQKKSLLDERVLELFIGLGDATNDDLDLDEALMDLIYFVVDILQFNGERNAYDEIDFDAIVIETLDALRVYHNSTREAQETEAHMILILDKSLHMFPWESIPCLQSYSISRLPSLSVLRQRILAAKSSNDGSDARQGHHISAQVGGTTILNPSGDLKHTVKTLKPRLDGMRGDWSHILNRPPSETEFESALKDKELVMYFGHGSGAQFLKSKSVQRLYPGRDANKPGCATTFLFGCSSVHLSDNGIYEPSGMLASYLTAGAPAVVGMLWDVTDKDCDRLAVRTGELWGLWPETKDEKDAAETMKPSKGKGKVAQLVAEVESAKGTATGRRGKKVKEQMEDHSSVKSTDRAGRRGIGLDEAVRAARDACVLRYLNGAAAVVYGIPVFLE